jgi:endonuclease YncB( thermonuclease family)
MISWAKLTGSSHLLAAALVFSSPAVAQTVTDGDTIKMAGTTYRLWGIDAPERRQTCADRWPAGRIATEYLVNLMHGHTITCEPRTKDRYGRTVALCRADGVDIEAEMVRNGMALAFVRYSRDYVALEEQARAEGLGMHAHGCEKPWDWRFREEGINNQD